MAGAIERTVNELEGAFSFVVLYEDSIYAVRDQWGFRPLVLDGTSMDTAWPPNPAPWTFWA